MNTYSYVNLDSETYRALLRRPVIDYRSIFGIVQPIIDEIRADGDRALIRLTQKYDGVRLSEVLYRVRPGDQIALDPSVKAAFDIAFANINAFHQAQMPAILRMETMPGVVCERHPRAIQRVGLYVPGGTAVLPSSVLMLGVPAMLAGCETVVLATPPNREGGVAAEVEYAAWLCGIGEILLAGGAQAVAAMAFGTESVSKVDKIMGPGNQYVTAAKMVLQNSDAMISIDMPAGPSELLVVADASANPAFVAADLLSQAEHGKDSQVVLVTLPGFDLPALQSQLDTQLNALPRSEMAHAAIQNSYIVACETLDQAFHFTNDYAPEHLIVAMNDADQHLDRIQNAGSVFLGHHTPESVGDYASGTNHTLPTYGYARMYSGVSTDSYLRQMTVQSLTQDGLRLLGPHVEHLARAESLEAHARAVSIRLSEYKNI
jgi:histidinol dehydrogenase